MSFVLVAILFWYCGNVVCSCGNSVCFRDNVVCVLVTILFVSCWNYFFYFIEMKFFLVEILFVLEEMLHDCSYGNVAWLFLWKCWLILWQCCLCSFLKCCLFFRKRCLLLWKCWLFLWQCSFLLQYCLFLSPIICSCGRLFVLVAGYLFLLQCLLSVCLLRLFVYFELLPFRLLLNSCGVFSTGRNCNCIRIHKVIYKYLINLFLSNSIWKKGNCNKIQILFRHFILIGFKMISSHLHNLTSTLNIKNISFPIRSPWGEWNPMH